MDNLKDRIQADLKTALLAGDKDTAEVLRGLKSVILYAEVAAGNREDGGLDDAAILALFAKEAKKRQESADLYAKGGSQEKADKELSEKAVIDAYLPQQLTEAEIVHLLDDIIAANGAVTKETMGTTIGAVKAKAGSAADGALVARLVRERIAS